MLKPPPRFQLALAEGGRCCPAEAPHPTDVDDLARVPLVFDVSEISLSLKPDHITNCVSPFGDRIVLCKARLTISGEESCVNK